MVQTVLGSNGQIGQELVNELYTNYTKDIRLVSRNPKRIHPEDQLISANLIDLDETQRAIEGSEIVYFTVGLPMNSDMWEDQLPTILDNVIEACKLYQAKFVFFDNTYMYAKNATPQTEESPFVPVGRKSMVRAQIAERVVSEIDSGKLKAVICRASEFYGPDQTKSITNNLIFSNFKAGKKMLIPVSDTVLRTLIWTPDASRAMALIANTSDTYGETWHLPSDDPTTYANLISRIQTITGESRKYSVIKMWEFKLGGLFVKSMRESEELLPRYKYDNIFISDKFKQRFPEFKITTFNEGIRRILVY